MTPPRTKVYPALDRENIDAYDLRHFGEILQPYKCPRESIVLKGPHSNPPRNYDFISLTRFVVSGVGPFPRRLRDSRARSKRTTGLERPPAPTAPSPTSKERRLSETEHRFERF